MRDPARVLIVDDDVAMCDYLMRFLEARGCTGDVCHTAEEAVSRFERERPTAVLLDVVLPGEMDGLAALAAFRKLDRDVPVIVLSGYGRTATVVQAMKLGASDFVSKPFVDSDLDAPLAHALRQRQVAAEVAMLREQLHGDPRHTLLFGTSSRMNEVRELIERVADTDVTVLVLGESGTGKELVARALYTRSQRHDKPFVKVNCAALPTELLESELFGFERGAFTGAIQHKPGKFEFANHGTMFLDEVSEMSPPLQAKLLQVLQDGEFSRLGSKADVHVDVRLIAATNRDLERAVAEGRFREDLFFRLNVVGITLPPLRERREDIPRLTDFFLKKYSVQYHKPLMEISATTLAMFAEYDWPGNVRELENAIKRAVVLASEAPIQRDLQQALTSAARVPHAGGSPVRAQVASPTNGHHGPAPPSIPAAVASVAPAAPPAPARPEPPRAAAPSPPIAERYSLKDISRTAAREAERELILRMLQHTRWNRKETAEMLGISYKALLYKIKENGLDRAS
jgi:DNA-binding NtrC family response regulator